MFENAPSIREQLNELQQERDTLLRQNRELQRKALLEMPDETLPSDVEKMADLGITDYDKALSPKLAAIVEKQHYDQLGLQARLEAEAFVAATPEYFVCADNCRTMTDFMVRNHLAPKVSNFQLAFAKLKAAGLIVSAPVDAATTYSESSQGFSEAQLEKLSAADYAKAVGLKRGFAPRWC